MVHHIDAWTYSPGLPGLFGISADVDGDKFEPRNAAILAEIEKIKSLSVSADEVHKAIKQFISATLSSRKTMEGQAQNLGGNWLAANDLNFSERYLAAVKHVTHDRRPARGPPISHAGKPHALRAAARRRRAEGQGERRDQHRQCHPENRICQTA